MKNMRNIVIGIIIGIMLTVSANAAVQYSLSQSEWTVVVDGQAVEDERYPVLLMDPGYNYLAAGLFREICDEAGLPFEANAESKEIHITTSQPVAVKSVPVEATPTVAPAIEYREPATIERDGVKKVLISDVYKMMKAKGYEIMDSGNSNWTLWIYDNNNKPILKDVPFSMHQYNGQGVGFIDHDYYIDNIKPLITN